MVMSLIYASHCLLDHEDPEFKLEIEVIRNLATVQNIKHDITGFLFFFDSKFVQIIEGDFEDVTNLYKCIRRDKRHDCCRIIEFCEIPTRAFSVRSLPNSMDFIRTNSSELNVKMKFLNRFIGDYSQTSIKIRDLLSSIAHELEKKHQFLRIQAGSGDVPTTLDEDFKWLST